ncbi:MAG: hypothetical protein WC763_04905 [Candidatus Paceibacterota bacterium]|jgi:hypothetical protein
MNTIIISNNPNSTWGKGTQINEIERVISSNKNSLTTREIMTMSGYSEERESVDSDTEKTIDGISKR